MIIKEQFSIYFLLMIMVFHTSCKGQENSSPKENIKEKIEKKEVKSPPSDYDPYFTETQSVEKSFGPVSITRNILQDKNGNYWLASWEGILRYDGKVFTNFTNKDSLRRHHVFSILEDKMDNLWFGTIGAGVYLYDGTTFTNFTKDNGLAHDRIGCFHEDKKGNIWIGTEAGINRYDGNGFKKFLTDSERDNNDINAIIEDDLGNLWIGTRGKAFIYDGEKFTAITYNHDIPFTNVRTIIKDKNGVIWLGGNDGLWSFENNTFTNLTKEFVGYIYEDSKGYIWTSSTINGDMQNWTLTRYQINLLPIKNNIPTLIEPNVGMLFGIMEDDKGDIWFGFLEGVGRYDGKNFDFFREK